MLGLTLPRRRLGEDSHTVVVPAHLDILHDNSAANAEVAGSGQNPECGRVV
jgi:hypothetical protein